MLLAVLLLFSAEFISPPLENFDCHRSSLVEVDGALVAIWNGGEGEGKSNSDFDKGVGIWLSRSEEGKWDEAKEIVASKESICWSPVLAKCPSGELALFYRLGENPRQAASLVIRSTDGGRSWSEAEILPAGIVGPTGAAPLISPDGNLISPSSVESGEPESFYKATACWIEISKDDGHTWQKIGPLEIPQKKFGAIEPSLFYDEEGRIKLLCRDRANRVGEKGWIWTATSLDGGQTWSSLEKTDLPNPDSGIATVDLGNGKTAVIYNDSHLFRNRLTLGLSLDGGNTWKPTIRLEENSGEFPSAILASDGLLHITYAFTSRDEEGRRIKHVVLDPKNF